MIRLQLGEDWNEVHTTLGYEFCLLFTTKANGHLGVKIIRRGNSTQASDEAMKQAESKLNRAVSALPPPSVGQLAHHGRAGVSLPHHCRPSHRKRRQSVQPQVGAHGLPVRRLLEKSGEGAPPGGRKLLPLVYRNAPPQHGGGRPG